MFEKKDEEWVVVAVEEAVVGDEEWVVVLVVEEAGVEDVSKL